MANGSPDWTLKLSPSFVLALLAATAAVVTSQLTSAANAKAYAAGKVKEMREDVEQKYVPREVLDLQFGRIRDDLSEIKTLIKEGR